MECCLQKSGGEAGPGRQAQQHLPAGFCGVWRSRTFPLACSATSHCHHGRAKAPTSTLNQVGKVVVHGVAVHGSIQKADLGACLLPQKAPWWPEGMPSGPGWAWLH